MARREYVTVRLPKELLNLVDDLVKDQVGGYRSRAEFVAEAIREKLAKFERFPR